MESSIDKFVDKIKSTYGQLIDWGFHLSKDEKFTTDEISIITTSIVYLEERGMEVISDEEYNSMLHVKRISCVRSRTSTDTLYLYSDDIANPFPDNSSTMLKMEVPRNDAEKYVAENFPGIPFELIEVK